MTQQDNASSLASRQFVPFVDNTMDEAILDCSYDLFAKFLRENVVCFAEYRSFADRHVAYAYFLTRPQLLAHFKEAMIRKITFESVHPSERLFNEMFTGAFAEIYMDVVAKRKQYLDPYYGEASPLASTQSVARGVLGSGSDEPLSEIASILSETSGFNPFDPFNRGGDSSAWDHLVYLSTELLAWLVSQHVECSLEDRRMSDWFAAEGHIHDNQLILIGVLQMTYTPIPVQVSREFFHAICMEMFAREYNALIANRDKYLGAEYGKAVLIPVPDVKPFA